MNSTEVSRTSKLHHLFTITSYVFKQWSRFHMGFILVPLLGFWATSLSSLINASSNLSSWLILFQIIRILHHHHAKLLRHCQHMIQFLLILTGPYDKYHSPFLEKLSALDK